jgi:hypothetical protein
MVIGKDVLVVGTEVLLLPLLLLRPQAVSNTLQVQNNISKMVLRMSLVTDLYEKHTEILANFFLNARSLACTLDTSILSVWVQTVS